MKQAVVGGLMLALAGCAASSTGTTTSVRAVSAAETALAAAGHVVMACYADAACELRVLALKPQIKTAYDAAYAAVIAAQSSADAGGSPDMTAANGALTTLQDLVSQLPKSKT